MLHKPGLLGDHAMAGIELDLDDASWNHGELTTRSPPKPIGWQNESEQRQAEWDMSIAKWSEDWTTA